jgi:hypothetical protein
MKFAQRSCALCRGCYMPKSRALQRQLGQYWTPEVLVDFMLDIAQFQPDWKVIDPACGEGSSSSARWSAAHSRWWASTSTQRRSNAPARTSRPTMRRRTLGCASWRRLRTCPRIAPVRASPRSSSANGEHGNHLVVRMSSQAKSRHSCNSSQLVATTCISASAMCSGGWDSTIKACLLTRCEAADGVVAGGICRADGEHLQRGQWV